MSYNTRSPAVKRLMKEAQELSEPTELFFAKPLEDNLFEWHFTIRGPTDTDYDGGIYHGRILLPAEYPMKPPNILLMTPSGRFEINRKICLSISGYHPETWRPSWSIRTALLAIIGFMPTHGIGAIGSLDYPPEERRKLAKISSDFSCPDCGSIKNVLKSLTEASVNDVMEAKDLAAQISFTGDKAVDKSVESVESKPVGNEKAKVEELPVQSSQPLQQQQQSQTPPSDILTQPNNLFLMNNEHMQFLPTAAAAMNLKPLSFEEWYVQVKCAEQTSAQPTRGVGDHSVRSDVDTPDCTTSQQQQQQVMQSFVSIDDGQVNAQGNTVVESSSSASPTDSPTVSPPSPPLPLPPPPPPSETDINLANENEVRQRHTPPAESAVPVVNNRPNIDLVSIRQRQSVLLKCIVLLAGVLGFILAVRLNNMHREINN